MSPTPGWPGPAAGAAPLSLQPGPPQQPVVVGWPPGALPGVAAGGHAAARRAPGQAWALTRAPSAAPDRPAGAPHSLPRSGAAAGETKAALQSSSNSSSFASPAPPRPEQPAPRRGPGTGRLGWHRPGKSVRAKSWPGVVGATRPESAPVPPEELQEHHIPTAMPQTPHPTWGARSTPSRHRCSGVCIYAYTPRLGT